MACTIWSFQLIITRFLRLMPLTDNNFTLLYKKVACNLHTPEQFGFVLLVLFICQ